MNTKTIGEISEANIIAALITHGWTVSNTFGDNKRYDIVADDGSRLYRVQCKTGRLIDGVVKFHCSSRGSDGGNVGYHGQVDLFAVFCRENHRVYLVPIGDCGVSEMYLRIEYPKSLTPYKANWASKYILGAIPNDHFSPDTVESTPETVPTEKQVAARVASRKLSVTREELAELVHSKPLREVANQLGISDVAVKKNCVRLGIATPPRGYWLTKRQ